MQLKLPFIVLFLVGSGVATTHAQELPASGTEKPTIAADSSAHLATQLVAESSSATAAAEDTVHALTTLYSRRRVGGASWITGGTLGGLRALTAAGQQKTVSTSYGTYMVNDGASGGGIAVGIGLILLVDGYGLSKVMRFSAAKQVALIADVRAGKPLPPNVRRRLKPRFFRQVLVPYKSVSYQPAN